MNLGKVAYEAYREAHKKQRMIFVLWINSYFLQYANWEDLSVSEKKKWDQVAMAIIKECGAVCEQ